MIGCAALQERLADEGVALLARDAAIRAHVDGCPECGAFLEALEQVEAGLARLPAVPPGASLISRTAKAVAGEVGTAIGNDMRVASARKLASALAATVVVAAGFALVDSVHQEVDRVSTVVAGQLAGVYRGESFARHDAIAGQPSAAKAPARRQVMAEKRANDAAARAMPESESLREAAPSAPLESARGPLPGIAAGAIASGDASLLDELAPQVAQERRDMDGSGRLSRSSTERDRAFASAAAPPAPNESPAYEAAPLALSAREPAPTDKPATPPESVLEFAKAVQAAPEPAAKTKQRESEGNKKGGLRAGNERLEEAASAGAPLADTRGEFAQHTRRSAPGKAERAADGKDTREQKALGGALGGLVPSPGPRRIAEEFLAERENLEGLRFQPSSGYWANTYVPGDPAIRLLEARLQRWDRSALMASLGDARLEAAAGQNRQPFDVPRNAALAVYLHADKRAVGGRSRLRVQVGLQASQKRSGLRPDMNVGVVLDLRRPVDDATGTRLRALVMALVRARQPGDRFSITVAGHPGGLLVAQEAFRHGPVRIALQSLFSAAGNRTAPALDLLAAMQTATESVRQGDDASAPLGASQILLVSTAPLDEQRDALERMAHENAVAGIGLSVIAVGDGADLASIDRLVLLGQGHRRVLAAPDDAAKLVDRELHAASRAVARAVRLRIRLAPGVELIDVLGSENLTEQAAQRVREAERSIDQRLARNIGIRADRGEDEEGIQIVIPSFFAGDSHAVLLDVVVPGPGPVADVSVRFKDLVYRRNGVARARLAIEDGHRGPGPLERNVLKNQLAHALAESAALAGRQLAAGHHSGAVQTLRGMRDLLVGLRLEIPGWDSDREIDDDVALLEQYLKALDTRYAGVDQHRHHLSDSLRYLAVRRLIPPYK